MSLISKICVLFLMWTIIGTGLYFGGIVYWYTRGFMLDPYRKGFGVEYMKECVTEMYACLGLPDPYTRPFITVKRSDRNTVAYKVESILLWFTNGMAWPLTVSCAVKGFGSTYRRYKDEYDRGIRVRKEPS